MAKLTFDEPMVAAIEVESLSIPRLLYIPAVYCSPFPISFVAGDTPVEEDMKFKPSFSILYNDIFYTYLRPITITSFEQVPKRWAKSVSFLMLDL